MRRVLCFGNTAHGELGLGGIEEESILTPRSLDWLLDEEIEQVACGRHHTLFRTNEGKLYSSGCNDYGQLGQQKATKRPRMSMINPIDDLEEYNIVQVSCGHHHSLALTEWGELYGWGSNEYGQLGNGQRDDFEAPKQNKFFANKVIVQICSGSNHSMALTNSGELYTWGSNLYGQLGIGSADHLEQSNTPQLVDALAGVPIAFIAAGGNHSFAVSKSGAVFAWGLNTSGQLGLNDEVNRCRPTLLSLLRNIGVRYIACGDEFTTLLTVDGGVFTCGAGTYGQLGHGTYSNESLPRKVTELMGSTVTQVACGSRHVMALVPSRGRVYSFGLGSSGQLGTRTTTNAAIPQVVVGPWVSPSGDALLETEYTNGDAAPEAVVVRKIFCGGEHSIVTTTKFADKVPPVDYHIYDEKTQILKLTVGIAQACMDLQPDETIDTEFLAEIECIFKSQACLNGSFLLDSGEHQCCSFKHHGVDIDKALQTFDLIRNIENKNLKAVIYDQIVNELLPSLSHIPTDVEALRIYLLLPLYHEFVNPKNYKKLHTTFSTAVRSLVSIATKILTRWWGEMPLDSYERLVGNYRDVVAYIISTKIQPDVDGVLHHVPYNPDLSAALKILIVLHVLDSKVRRVKVNSDAFVWDELQDFVNIQHEYINWMFKNDELDSFNLCNYPFLFNVSAKTALLQTDQAMQMHRAMHGALNVQALVRMHGLPLPNQYLVLNVSRDNIVQDTLREILRHNRSDLKKPLKVRFTGEEAEDAGGVRKEFFMLLIKDLLDAKYGMFKESEETHNVWFADHSFESTENFFLVGVLCALAIYNFSLIRLPFPLALYKKIIGEPVSLDDLADIMPTVAKSLKSLLDYEGDDFEEVFGLKFEETREYYGVCQIIPLMENGSEISVTQANKHAFVEAYVNHVLNLSVEEQFTAFDNGFKLVCSGRVLKIFKAEELMAAVIGNEEYNWLQMEESATYRGDYSTAHQTIQWFWEVFHELPLVEKKNFLLFLTGSNRVPVQGMKAIKICIQPMSDERYLPVAHTCFNLLDLPLYKTKERLKFKLLQAIQQTIGFTII